MNCIKIGLPGKLILSKRKGLGKSYSLDNGLRESNFREDLFYTIGPWVTLGLVVVGQSAAVAVPVVGQLDGRSCHRHHRNAELKRYESSVRQSSFL